jgi:hypothetical protein
MGRAPKPLKNRTTGRGKRKTVRATAPSLPKGATVLGWQAGLYGPAWLAGNFPWTSDDPQERCLYAAQLFLGALESSGDSSSYTRAVTDVVRDFLEGQRHFGRFPFHAARMAAGLVTGTPEESAMKMGLDAMVRLMIEMANGRAVPKAALQAFRRGAKAIEPNASPLRGAKQAIYEQLQKWVRNNCDGSRERLRFVVRFAVLRYYENPQGAKTEAFADEATERLLASRPLFNGHELARENMKDAPAVRVQALTNAILRAIRVEPPRSGDRKLK